MAASSKAIAFLNVSDTLELKVDKINSNYKAVASQRDEAISDALKAACSQGGVVYEAIQKAVKGE